MKIFRFVASLVIGLGWSVYGLAQVTSGQSYQIVSSCSSAGDKVLSITGTSTADGAPAVLALKNKSQAAQIFKFNLNSATGAYHIVAQHSGKSLDVHETVTSGVPITKTVGARIQQWTRAGSQTNQLFRVIRTLDGFYSLQAVHSGYYIDLSGANTAVGTPFIQYPGNGTCAQKFKLENIVTGAPSQGFTVSGSSFAPSSASAGQTVTLNSTLTSTINASGINVYFEIFDGSTKVTSKEFSNQSFTAGIARSFNWSYAIPATMAAKPYLLKLAVYNSNWTTLLAVKDIGTLTVTNAPPPPLSFTISNASFSPTSASLGQSVTLNSKLTSNINASGINVYFHVYDGPNSIASRQFDNQSFIAGVTQTFSWPYVIPSTLAAKGYQIKLAVYNSNWTTLLAYSDMGTLTVTAGTPPPVTARVVPASFFGMHVGAVELEPWPSIPFDGIRSWDSWPGIAWRDIQASRGTYDWSHLDAFVNMAVSQRANITYTFGYVPEWASTNPGGNCDGAPLGSCYAPKDADWQEFVGQITNRYRGRIHNYEMWNEPNAGNFYKGSYAQLANMEKLASPIIRAAGAKVLAPSPQGPTSGNWLASYFAAGGGANADVITFHSYLYGPAENIIPLVTSIRGAMSSYGLAGKPLWDTEHSWGDAASPDGNTPEKRAAWLARQKVLSASAGIDKSFWYMWDSIGPTYYGQLFDRWTKVLLAPGIAHREVRNWLVDASITPCTASGTVYQCKLTRTGGYEALIVWNTSTASSFTAPAGYTVYKTLSGSTINVSGGVVPIGQQPVMIEKPGI